MTTATAPSPSLTTPDNLEDFMSRLQEILGDVPLARIRMKPFPGTATEQDVIDVEAKTGRLCELVDGVLVEKPRGWYESRLAAALIYFLEKFMDDDPLGIVLAGDALVRLQAGRVRMPDVSFFHWDQFPNRLLPSGQILGRTPDFAVEVLSPSNTDREMELKRGEYFAGGCRLVWQAYPPARRVRAYTEVDQFTEVGEDGTLTGDPVLPGFRLPVRHWFDRAGQWGGTTT